jgi:hypothetical protein
VEGPIITPDSSGSSGGGGSGGGGGRKLSVTSSTPKSTPITTFTPAKAAIKKEDDTIQLQPTEKLELKEPSRPEKTNEVPISVTQKIKDTTVYFINIIQKVFNKIISKISQI